MERKRKREKLLMKSVHLLLAGFSLEDKAENSSMSLLSVGVRGEKGSLVGAGLLSTGSQGSLAGGTLPSTAQGSLPQMPGDGRGEEGCTRQS